MNVPINVKDHDLRDLDTDDRWRLAREIQARQVLGISSLRMSLHVECPKCSTSREVEKGGQPFVIVYDGDWLCRKCDEFTAKILSIMEFYA